MPVGFDPTAAAPRLVEHVPQRQASFEGAQARRRLSAFNPTREHVNGLLALQGHRLLARTRDLVRNNPYILSARESFVANAVGTGIVPSWLDVTPRQKARIEKAWLAWTDEADADGVCDLYGLQALTAGCLFEAGECFVRRIPQPPGRGLTVPLQLRLYESEQCPVDLTRREANGNWTRSGVEIDPQGRRAAYWFYRQHPGDSTSAPTTGDYVRIPADEVLHLFRPTRPGQLRGAPWIAAAVVKAFMLDKYDDAELDRKGTAALFAGFIEQPARGAASPLAGTKEDPESPGVAIAGLQPGTMQILEPGEKITFSEPADVGGQYESFEYRTILQLCAATGVPYTAVTGDLRAANYSSLRAGMLEYRRRLEQLQHNTLVFQLCRPIASAWIRQAALSGALSLPAMQTEPQRYCSIKWIPPRFPWVDPLKDRKAEEVAVANGWKSNSDVIEEEGLDAEQVYARIAADQERARRYGIGPFPGSGKTAAVDPTLEDPVLADETTKPTAPTQEEAA